MYSNPNIESSYKENNLGKTLYEEIIALKPQKVIDFGVLNGYSTVCIAQALKHNGKGKVKVHDLFDKYEYNGAKFEKLIKTLKKHDLLDYVEIEEANFFDWIKTPEQFDVLHLDISNTGDILDMVWDNLKDNGVVLFEGGSEQRDRVGWMIMYNKKAINKSRAKFEVINKAFPSLSKIIWQN